MYYYYYYYYLHKGTWPNLKCKQNDLNRWVSTCKQTEMTGDVNHWKFVFPSTPSPQESHLKELHRPWCSGRDTHSCASRDGTDTRVRWRKVCCGRCRCREFRSASHPDPSCGWPSCRPRHPSRTPRSSRRTRSGSCPPENGMKKERKKKRNVDNTHRFIASSSRESREASVLQML